MVQANLGTLLNADAGSCSTCAGDEVVIINVLTDSFGGETSWTLEDVATGVVWASVPSFTL